MKVAFSLSLLTFAIIAAAPAGAQQITGTPGSPNATTTIEGNQLPPPPPKFGGVIEEEAKNSTPWWPPRVRATKGGAERAADYDR